MENKKSKNQKNFFNGKNGGFLGFLTRLGGVFEIFLKLFSKKRLTFEKFQVILSGPSSWERNEKKLSTPEILRLTERPNEIGFLLITQTL